MEINPADFQKAYREFSGCKDWAASHATFKKYGDIFMDPQAGNLLETLEPGGEMALFLLVLSKACARGVDEAFADFLDPWMMVAIKREMTVAIAEAGDSSGKMFRLFSEHTEIMRVLHLCKPLKATPLPQLISEIPLILIELITDAEAKLEENPVLVSRLRDYHTLQEFPKIHQEFIAFTAKQGYELNFASILSDYQPYFAISRILDSYYWAINQDQIGLLLKNRLAGNRQQNIMMALRLYEGALPVFEKGNYAKDLAIAKSNLGNVYCLREDISQEEKLETAIRHFREGIKVISKDQYPELWASLHDNLSTAIARMDEAGIPSRMDEALANSVEALRAFQLAGNDLEAVKAMQNLSQMHFMNMDPGTRTQNLQAASNYCQEALAVKSPSITDKIRFELNASLGNILVRRSDKEGIAYAEEAIPHLLEAISLYKGEKHKERFAELKFSLSMAYTISGKVEQAIHAVEEALQFGRNHASARWTAEVQIQKAGLFAKRRVGDAGLNRRESIRCYESGIAYYQENSELERWAEYEAVLSPLILNTPDGDFRQAIKHSLRRLEFIRPMLEEDSISEALISGALGGVYMANFEMFKNPDDIGKALRLLKHGVSILKIADPERNLDYFLYNIACLISQNPESTQKNYKEALLSCLEILENDSSKENVLAVSILLTASRLNQSLMAFQVPDAEKNCRHHLNEAIELLRNQKTPDPDTLTQVLMASAEFHCKAGEWQLAIDHLLELDETLQKNNESIVGILTGEFLTAKISECHEWLAWCYIKLGEFTKALKFIFSSGTRMLNQVTSIRNQIKQLPPMTMFYAYDLFYKMLKWEEIHLGNSKQFQFPEGDQQPDETAVQRQLELLDNEWKRTVPFSYRAIKELTDPGELLSGITENETIVIPFIVEFGTVIIVLRHGMTGLSAVNFRFVPGFAASDVEDLLGRSENDNGWINEMLYFSKERDFVRWDLALRKFSELIWKKLGKSIQLALSDAGTEPGSKLIFIINGRLSFLPLHLAGPGAGIENCFAGLFRTSCLPSLAALTSIKETPSRIPEPGPLPESADGSNYLADKNLFLLCDPTGTLPYAKMESALISGYFDQANVTMFDDEKATPENLREKSGENDFLHFACHGNYNPGYPLLSGLIVGKGTLLPLTYIIEIWDLSKSSLVALSSCQSSLTGPSVAPSENIGMVLAFLIAGASQVVSTLWDVDDLATMLLMSKFYEHIDRGQPIDSSLRLARRWLAGLTVAELREILSGYRLLADNNKALNEESKKRLHARINLAKETDKLFESPAYWGGFILNGI